tara:strand:- start:113 stop:337 length:225 start_codon:yes stop_codon:yes gene_type:complete
MIKQIQYFFELHAFGVCTWWGQKLGIHTNRIRMFFIYISFFTLGSPIILYFAMAFVLENKQLFKLKRRSTVWDY